MRQPSAKRNEVLLHYKVWLSNITGEGILGEGKIHLLQEIARRGSLSAAAESMGLSYRKAWGDIRKAESLLGYALTDKKRGGKAGGSSLLTQKAQRLLEAYSELRKTMDSQIEEAFRAFKSRIEQDSGGSAQASGGRKSNQ